MKFKIGQKVKVLSGEKPLTTVIKDVVYDESNKAYKYYFEDDKGVLWHEYDEAITTS